MSMLAISHSKEKCSINTNFLPKWRASSTNVSPVRHNCALMAGPRGKRRRRQRGARTDRPTAAACGLLGGHASSAMNGSHSRTLWAAKEEGSKEGGKADQGMKKSVVGIKPNGSCYFSFSRRDGKKEERMKEWDRLDWLANRPSVWRCFLLLQIRCNDAFLPSALHVRTYRLWSSQS